ncbi:MAG TPA: hypothetical protein VHI99_25840 [Vicinamibacterales bacterium]|jgi:hypothetical protein|nr:hypothetical protein [Vicinamibacterales bacterium]
MFLRLAELGELFVDGLKGLFEHAAVMWRSGLLEVVAGTGAGQLERFATLRIGALLFGKRGAHGARARGLVLLRLN